MKLTMLIFAAVCTIGAFLTKDEYLGVYAQIWIVGSILKED